MTRGIGARVVGLAVPNLNQGRFLQAAFDSIQSRTRDLRIALMDGGSTDESLAVIDANRDRLAYARSQADAGQAAAINEGLLALDASGPLADVVGWLNADDFYLPNGLDALVDALDAHPEWVAVAGGGVLAEENGTLGAPIETRAFDPEIFSTRCTICQPASLVRASAWRAIGGLDASLQMCLDYDLWWRLSHVGTIGYLPVPVAASRDHDATKTRRRRAQYFREAMAVVQRERGVVPWHWFISDAIEREAGYEYDPDRRPPLPRLARAGLGAGIRYIRHRAFGRGV